jgi:hypothetical protein
MHLLLSSAPSPINILPCYTDIVERFTLALMLTVVAFRNLIELYGTESDLTEGFILPKSFGWFRGNNVIWTISYVMLLLPQFDVFLKVNFDCSLCSR